MAEGKYMGNEWVRPARCCLGFSFWLVQPFPLCNIWSSSATGKPNNFNKTGRKHNALKNPNILMLAWSSSRVIN